MKRKKSQCPLFEHYSYADKLRYKQKVLDLSEVICSDDATMTKLTSYTLNKLRYFTRHHSINGMEAQDFIQEAILKTVEGNRFWQGETVEQLLNHFYCIIPSLIANECKKTKLVESTHDEFGPSKIYKDKFVRHNPPEDDEEKISEIMIKGTDTSILDALVNQEIIKQTELYIYKELEKNEDYIGTYLYEAHLDGVSEPHKHVANILNLPIEEVRNADKRLKRIINKAMRFQNEG
ncbi:Hypothetical protein IALB_2472 [Ignavibacterium album JCM 16511]|uniref:Uncharacterized protein n=1 Tax=Ignavibacterium album (strain DSM 19864 / JCM 16511 / NBRC 101810 / Mat9-16) TaxID=945713 RepID=I0AMG8_IGNAJ|nr:hypothetical protein [Ignavibacterium album]AFH50175.1 Hypothetical protein IALB_2472 [Ignavibacterium album JCM 16511]